MALNKTMTFDLELKPGGIPPIVHASQGDIGRMFKANIYWDGSAATSYISGATVNLRGKKPDKTVFDYTATLAGSMVTFETTEQMTIISGPVECELVFSQGGDVIASANFVLMVEDSPYNPDALSESDIPGIVDLIEDTIGGDVRDEVQAELEAHPEWTTTVQDGAITKAKINTAFLPEIENAYVTPEQFGAIENGVADVAKLQNMVDYALANNKYVRLISDFSFPFTQGGTVQNPTRVLIKNADGFIVDGGGHTVTMTGLTKAYLDTIDDISSSGRDIFTVFSFVLSDNCIVKNLNIKGDYVFTNNSNNGEFRYASPRAKGIGLTGCNNCVVENCYFDGILGNGVNLTASSASMDGTWRRTANCSISKCVCKNSLENGFNNMGGTRSTTYSQVSCIDCQQGIETGGGSTDTTEIYTTLIVDCAFYNCRVAVIANANDVITNCAFYEVGLTFGRNSHATVTNCYFRTNRAIQPYPSSNFMFIGCRFEKPKEWLTTAYARLISAVGSQAEPITGTIQNCVFDMDADYTIYFSYAIINILGSVFSGTHNPQIYNYYPVGTCYISDTVYYRIHGDWIINNNCEVTTHKVTSITSSSTDAQYPTAKAVYDFVMAQLQ